MIRPGDLLVTKHAECMWKLWFSDNRHDTNHLAWVKTETCGESRVILTTTWKFSDHPDSTVSLCGQRFETVSNGDVCFVIAVTPDYPFCVYMPFVLVMTDRHKRLGWVPSKCFDERGLT